MAPVGKLIEEMTAYYAGDVRRINHFIKVYGFAKAIGECEGLDSGTLEILEIAAFVHDIGIKNSEIKYGSSAGKLQESEGPPEARKLLGRLGTSPAVMERVCWLVAHHHTYTDINGSDYQILLEADFLVNAFEDALSEEAVIAARDRLFKTPAGKMFLNNLYLKNR